MSRLFHWQKFSSWLPLEPLISSLNRGEEFTQKTPLWIFCELNRPLTQQTANDTETPGLAPLKTDLLLWLYHHKRECRDAVLMAANRSNSGLFPWILQSAQLPMARRGCSSVGGSCGPSSQAEFSPARPTADSMRDRGDYSHRHRVRTATVEIRQGGAPRSRLFVCFCLVLHPN